MKTLVIVDVQNDFIPGGALAVPKGNEVVPIINDLLPHFELIVATQDWHPNNHKSFASNHENKQTFDIIELEGLEQKLWPDHCIQDTPGADFVSYLENRPIEAIFRKGMDPEIDSYSGFYDNGHKKSTGLAGYLKEKGTSELYFCGLAGDICVYFTLLDALKEGFTATLIEDASKPLDTSDYQKAKEDILKKGGKIVHSKDILNTYR
ncbi:bifunctional nicotinamidase/pyrazinamidase [Salinimicrobium sp. GXAS 041]|uniref:bifunctional nicotinamidase/pyrazinamidase n=1 Tax=Salinimicrobium sp. GXAS 041 TaxID=3400806 RepID=UPI003C7201CE